MGTKKRADVVERTPLLDEHLQRAVARVNDAVLVASALRFKRFWAKVAVVESDIRVHVHLVLLEIPRGLE